MNKVKSVTITTCVVLSSILLFSASALAAPAIVNSDPNLNFNNVKLQQVLTQDPESFIPVVAEQVAMQIKAKQQQQITVDIENKYAWDNTIKVILFCIIIVLLFAIVYYLDYNEWQETLNNANINYSKLLGQSTYLTGYTGATGKRADVLLKWANELNDKYLALKTFPSFINEVMYNETWIDYTTDLVNFSDSLNSLLEQIDTFLESIQGLSGSDPLAERIRLQELQDK